MATIPEALALAIQHHQAGRLQAAEQIYRQILASDPNHADALHLLGVIASQEGKHDLAVNYVARAIQVRGSAAPFHYSLGEAYRALQKLPEAGACYRRALELKPDFAERTTAWAWRKRAWGSWKKRSPATAARPN